MGGKPKDRKFVSMYASPRTDVITAFGRDIDTLERAVKERVFFVKSTLGFVPTPQPTRSVCVMLDSYSKALACELPCTSPLSEQQFVETFKGRKRQMYQKVFEEKCNIPCKPSDAHIRPFVKYEKVDVLLKDDPVPRVVSPRKPRYNIAVGRFLRPIEEKIFKAIGVVFGGPTVFKGYDAFQQGRLLRDAWLEFKDPVAFGLDASRFDQHVSRETLQWEHSVYLSCFYGKHRKELERLLKWQLDNVCYTKLVDGELKYTTKGVRMSGDMNTSVGACLIMTALVYTFMHLKGVHCRLINNGDDCVIICERSDYSRFDDIHNHFRSAGFTLTREPVVDVFEKIEFCQTHPVLTSKGWFMCRSPYSLLTKDHVCIQYKEGEAFEQWLAAIGSVAPVFSGIPCHRNVYRAFARCAKPKKIRAMERDDVSWSFRNLYKTGSTGHINDETRFSYYLAFGVTPEEQVSIEEHYDEIKTGSRGAFVPPLDRFI